MYSSLCLLALVGCATASFGPLLLGLHGFHDDGQWRPELDGSILGSGALQWGHEDGSWKPHLDGSILGSGHLGWLARHRRSLFGINPNALNVPLDTVHVAHAKQAQLIQQASEGARNILGGGVPLALPADTHEVAIGKQAHAVAHATQAALTAHHGLGIHGVVGPAAVGFGAVAPWGLGLGLGGWGVHGHHGW